MRAGGWWRWVRFNAVGGIGIVVQLTVLSTLTVFFEIHYLPATLLAVEVAIVHNFLWHERWTWKDRLAAGPIRRLARFNLTTGLVSLVGNLALMPLLVQLVRLSVLPANLAAIAVCSVANFLLADRVVFGAPEHTVPGSAGILPGLGPQASCLPVAPCTIDGGDCTSRQDACGPSAGKMPALPG